ncbi:MAG: RNA polymerase sigma factor [Polyangiaceae bacterium]|jgi:RNA polymerase sigma-70 factor, ECF subfamily
MQVPSPGQRDDGWKVVANEAMDRYASGDDSAFSTLYDVLAPRMHAFLLRRTPDPDLAADLLQQTFLQMHCARRHFTPKAEVLPWAFAIARRLVIDRVRKARHEPLRSDPPPDDGIAEPPSREIGPDDAIERAQITRRIDRELARLPAAHREAFELVKRDELSIAEAAQVLGTTVAAVKLRAHRCYLALRVSLADLADEWQVERE